MLVATVQHVMDIKGLKCNILHFQHYMTSSCKLCFYLALPSIPSWVHPGTHSTLKNRDAPFKQFYLVSFTVSVHHHSRMWIKIQGRKTLLCKSKRADESHCSAVIARKVMLPEHGCMVWPGWIIDLSDIFQTLKPMGNSLEV